MKTSLCKLAKTSELHKTPTNMNPEDYSDTTTSADKKLYCLLFYFISFKGIISLDSHDKDHATAGLKLDF